MQSLVRNGSVMRVIGVLRHPPHRNGDFPWLINVEYQEVERFSGLVFPTVSSKVAHLRFVLVVMAVGQGFEPWKDVNPC